MGSRRKKERGNSDESLCFSVPSKIDKMQKYSVQIPAFVSLMCKFLDINDNGMTNEALGFLS